MADINLERVPQPFPESSVRHLYRTAEVVIVKRLRNFIVPGSGEKETEHKIFEREFAEVLQGRKVLERNKDLDEKWEDPETGEPLYRHYQIIATSEPVSGAQGNINDVTTGDTNTDVYRITATTTTEGRGRCTIVLNSREGKYTFLANPLKRESSIFDANDRVYVNLPGLDDSLHRVFTGFVSTVEIETMVEGTLETNIHLHCDDMLKPLFESRTNFKPSLNLAEARGLRFIGLAPQFVDKLPHQIVSEIMARAYADLFTVPDFRTELTRIRNEARSDSLAAREKAALDEEKHISKHLPLPDPTEGVSVDQNLPFLATVGRAEQSVEAAVSSLVQLTEDKVKIPKRIYGFRRKRSDPTTSTVIDNTINEQGPIKFADPDDLAFVMDGTAQPLYQLAFTGATSLFVSDWKSSLHAVRKMAQDINYELFADSSGIVRFRPLNVTLPHDFKPGNPRLRTNQLDFNGRVGSEYWLDPKFITYERLRDTDENVFTISYIIGEYQGAALNHQIFAGAAVDPVRLLKLGPRVAPVQQKLNLLDNNVCAAYAQAYLSRLNASARSAEVTYMGDASLKVGNPCYLPHRNVVYYISSITHQFEVGIGYKCNLSLKYGRKPLAVRNDRVDALLERTTNDNTKKILRANSLDQTLGRMRDLDEGNVIIGNITGKGSAEVDYIRENEANLSFLDYVWEPMYTLSYEDLGELLREDYLSAAKKATSESSHQATNEYLAELKQFERVERILEEQGSVQSTTLKALRIDKQAVVEKAVKKILNRKGIGNSGRIF